MNETMTGIANQAMFWSLVFLFWYSVNTLLRFAMKSHYARRWYDYLFVSIASLGAVFFVIAVAAIIRSGPK